MEETPHTPQWPNTVVVKLLKRPTGGLGVVVSPRADHGPGLTVADLIPGGEAARTALLRPGDVILRVDDLDIRDLTYERGLQVLQEVEAGAEVSLLVRAAEGLTARLVTTFSEAGEPRVSRVTGHPVPEEERRPRTSVDEQGAQAVSRQNGASRSSLHPTSPERPGTLSANNNQGSRRSSVTSPSRRPVRLRNVITGQEHIETLFLKATETVECNANRCMGSLMSGPSKRPPGTPRPKEEVMVHAKQFFDQYFASIKRLSSASHEHRWQEVSSEVESTGSYELKEMELVYGAKLAWRNAPRCVGRIQWSKLQVFDARYVSTTREMFEALCNHIKYATNKGNIRSAITVFPRRTDGQHDFRIWNNQLIMYAGYKQEDGSVLGDPASADFTELCAKLGWKGKGLKWDLLPLVLSANGKDPHVYELPEELVLRVPIVHPKYAWFETELGLQWYGLPAVSSMLFDVGGVEFPAAPFNGWYMVTEIGSRDLCDPHRFNVLQDVATHLGVDTRAPSTLWKERAAVEVNYAVIYSFQRANVTIVDHHTACDSFLKHWESEMRVRGGCPADWVWIAPPLAASLTPVFHQELLCYHLKPSYDYQEPPWKTHVWEKDRETAGNGPRTPSRKFRFKEIARAVKFTSNLFGLALSRRIKASILFATETGRSEQCARTLADIFSHAFNAHVCCMSDYDIINLEHETLLLVVTSTFGNGDPPENGEAFARSLQAIKVTGDSTPDVEHISKSCMPFVRMNSMPLGPVGEEEEVSTPATDLDADIGPLSNVRFAVFGLGSSAYPNFCSFGRWVDATLAELGGERLLRMGSGDELCAQEHSFGQWAQQAFQVACDVFYVGDDIDISDVKATLQSDLTWNPDEVRLVKVPQETDLYAGISKRSNRKVVPCVLKKKTTLQAEEDSRETLFLELSTLDQPELKYFPGDHVAIYPANRRELVDGILERMRDTCPDPDQVYQLEVRKIFQTIEGPSHRWVPHDKLPAMSMRTALTRYLDVTTPPGQQFLRTLVAAATDPQDARKIQILATDSVRYEDWKSHMYPNLLEVLVGFPSLAAPPALLMALLPCLRPRFYSASSAPAAHPGRLHLTVAVVAYATQAGAQHYGVCSNYLASLPIESEMACFVRSAPNFRLPDDRGVPVIMVGPGTGIAPFRSFWQQRRLDVRSDTGEQQRWGRMTLLVGCRRPEVQLYREETRRMEELGVLSRVHAAYSRLPAHPKRYVQHILRELSESVYRELVLGGGHLYVCGDVSMAEDVNRTLRDVVRDQGDVDSVAAIDSIIKRLQEENRYHEDIFGITLKTAEVTNRGRAEAKNRRSTSSS